MALNDDLQSVFNNQFDTAASLAGKLAGNASKIVSEVQDIAATSVQAQAAFLSKLASARSPGDLIQIQADYAQAAFEATLERSKKFRELFAELSRDTVISVTAGAQPAKTPAKTLSIARKLQAAE
ncbi:phasin family protein [Rhodoblastus sp. 17X3]|uniref:phasin family protein n=1 Tax=Rhodoblastus sp. 17X3 TaxID=3047026 RepID=UPI0024B81937|nr:phasin family protein [Rhodoblastus sp. 17X3]MDI9849752.1 phasin family protein [Rhodoblastus sp. 17X3]